MRPQDYQPFAEERGTGRSEGKCQNTMPRVNKGMVEGTHPAISKDRYDAKVTMWLLMPRTGKVFLAPVWNSST